MSDCPAVATRSCECEEVEGLLPLIADGSFGVEDDPGVFEHLAHCANCQRSLATHDLISVALDRGQPMPAKPAIRFYRLPWTAAAAWCLVAGGAGWLAFGSGVLSADQPQVATAPRVDVLQVQGTSRGPAATVLVRVNDQLIEFSSEDAIAPGIDADSDTILRRSTAPVIAKPPLTRQVGTR